MAIYTGFSHKRMWFTIAVLNHQRVFPWNVGCPLIFRPIHWKLVYKAPWTIDNIGIDPVVILFTSLAALGGTSLLLQYASPQSVVTWANPGGVKSVLVQLQLGLSPTICGESHQAFCHQRKSFTRRMLQKKYRGSFSCSERKSSTEHGGLFKKW